MVSKFTAHLTPDSPLKYSNYAGGWQGRGFIRGASPLFDSPLASISSRGRILKRGIGGIASKYNSRVGGGLRKELVYAIISTVDVGI